MKEVRANSDDSARADEGAGRPVRVALLRHAPAAGNTEAAPHLDLFIGPVDYGDEDALVALGWRLPCGTWDAEGPVAGRFAAIETPPHRAFYLVLDAETELSDARGRITPLLRSHGVWRGERPCADAGAGGRGQQAASPRRFTIEGIRFGGSSHRIHLERSAEGNWTVEIAKEGPWTLH